MVLVAYLLDVSNSDATLQTSQGESRLIGKAAYASCLVFEGRFLATVFPGLATDIVNDEFAIGSRDNHEIPPNV
eukprot:CAMPEP_0168267470 /NCGR_PEP_ID=MMETSP0141_2-20121125/13120_1 /TAXON_ID=44445 /ORGANISM="Pseudo-nitzschia australis, Strain 10249 10 AB" /LENGTH=73 /DNA_ID=CAMNT_0008207669 /DNA_START=821 /DNA_END=1042 /DNA_ORIENTATION=+